MFFLKFKFGKELDKVRFQTFESKKGMILIMFKRIKKVLYRSIDNGEISYKRLKEIMRQDKSCILLDVRSKQEFKENHLNNAINIPLFDLEKQMAQNVLPDKNRNIIIYCVSGYRSKKVKEFLDELGYKNVYSLKNGLDGI